MSICSAEKMKLIEEVGLHFEAKANLTPLAARIFAICLLSKEEGYSFDEFKEITQASKSSVSTNLNLLLQLKYIEYYTKPGERKRYYRNAPCNLRVSLQEELSDLEKEISVVTKMNDFNKKHNPHKFKKDQSVAKILIDHLKNTKESLKKTIGKINEFETSYS